MAKFEAEISANVSGFVKDLNTAEKKADQFGKKVPTALNKTSKGFDNLSKSTGAANSTAMEFNRIIQDAPFGMMGIGNNIQQLTANFGQLKNQTGSTGAALKATFASMLTSGNLLSLGVAALTSAWTFYTMWQQKANKATKETKQSLTEYIDTLDGVKRALADGQVEAQKSLTSLRLIYDATQNVSLSTEQRLQAAKKLQQEYPNIFKNFSREQILLGESKEAYDRLTQSILATAQAAAVTTRITENSRKQLDNYLNILNKQNEANELNLKIKQEEASISKARVQSGIGEIASNRAIKGSLDDLKDSYKSIMDEITALGSENLEITEQNRLLQQNYNTQIADGANILGSYAEEKKKNIKADKDYKRQLIESLAQMGYYDAALAAITYKYQDITELARKAGASTQEFGRIAREELGEKLSLALGQSTGTEVKPTIQLGIDLDIPSSLPGLEKRLTEMKAPFINLFAEIQKEVAEIFEGGIENTVMGFASSIGEALVNGTSVIEAAGQSLLGGLGSIMVDLGAMAIKSGIAIEAVKTSLATLGGFGAIAAGIALVAIGSAFKAGASKLSGSMGSGGASGYSGNSVSSSSNAMPNYFQGAYSNNNTVVFEIEGDKLKGVLDRTDRKNRRTR